MNMRALIVDDNRDLADGLSAIFELENIDTFVVYNGEDGMRMLEQHKIDIFFIDVKLPDMCGIEIFSAATKMNPGALNCLMSGFRVEQIMDEVLGKGCSAIFRTAITPENIRNTFNTNPSIRTIVAVNANSPFNIGESAFIRAIGYKNAAVISFYPASDSELEPLRDNELVVIDLDKPLPWSLAVARSLLKLNPAIRLIINMPVADPVNSTESCQISGCLFKPFSPEKVLQLLNDYKLATEGLRYE